MTILSDRWVGEGKRDKKRRQHCSQAVDDGHGKCQTHDQDEDFQPWSCIQAFTWAIPHNERVLLDRYVLAEWGFDLIQQTHQLVDVM
jgi:hypothetical protein